MFDYLTKIKICWTRKNLKLNLRDGIGSEDSSHDYETASNDNIITNIFHDGCCFSCYQGQKYRSLVEIPEQKQLTTAGSCTPNMAKQVCTGVPEHTVKTQNNLWPENELKILYKYKI